MVKRIAGALAFLSLMLLVTCSGIYAQQDVSALTGVVTDKSGAEISDATVKILDARTGTELETKTDADGSYHFLRLQPGPGYTLTVSKDGFQSQTVSNLYLAVATTRTQNVRLEIGSINETVEVKSEGSVTLNTTDSTIGNNFDMRAVGTLPIEFRDDPSALLRLQPGVVSAQSEQTGAGSATDPAAAATVPWRAREPIRTTLPWMVSMPPTSPSDRRFAPRAQFPSSPCRNSAPR